MSKRTSALLAVVLAAVSWCAGRGWAQAGAPQAPPADQEMLAKQAKESGLKPGDVLGKDNWETAKDLLPPEILRHYKSGEYVNKIAAWPVGIEGSRVN